MRKICLLILVSLTFSLFYLFYFEPSKAQNQNLQLGLNSETQNEKIRRIVESSIFAEFEIWLKHYLEGNYGNDNEELKRGESLAVSRRVLFKELIKLAPESAIKHAVGTENYNRLPASINRHLERSFSADGDFMVQVATETDRSTGKRTKSWVEREIIINQSRYKAFVYGRRLSMTTKLNIPLRGVILEQTAAIDENPLHKLAPAEYESRNVDSSRIGEYGVVAEAGSRLVYFSNQQELDGYVRDLIEWESKIGPERPAEALGAGELASPWTEGPKSVLIIRVDFSDRPGEPVDFQGLPLTQTRALNMINNDVNPFFVNNSYNKTSLQPTVTTVVRLPQTQFFYMQGENYLAMLTDARNAARAAGFETNNFNLDIVAFSYFNGVGWAGRGYVGGKGTWINGEFNLRVAGHELGHNYGLWHANLWRTIDGTVIGQGNNQEYGDAFDLMGWGYTPAHHFNAQYKRNLDWLTDANIQTVTSNGVYRIFTHDSSSSGGIRALKIRKDATKDYWVEFRQLLTGNPSAMNGATIRWSYPHGGTGGIPETQLLDMTPNTSTNSEDAPLLIGQNFTDSASQVSITVLGKGNTFPESLDIRVETAPGCPTVTGLSATSGQVGGTVTIFGSNFNGVTAVKFTNNVFTGFGINPPGTQLTPVIPIGAQTGSITIVKPGCNDVLTSTFTVTVSCSYSISPTSQNFQASGGINNVVQVTAPNGCPWTAASNNITGNESLFNLLSGGDLLGSVRTAFGSSPPIIIDAGLTDSSNPVVTSNSSKTEIGVTTNNSAPATPAFSEGFENIGTLPGNGWFIQNNSVPVGSTNWFQGDSAIFPAQAGTPTSYITANYNNTTGTNTISNWLLTPNITFSNGDQIKFRTRTVTGNAFPDRLEVRLSTNGASTNVGSGSSAVGDFTNLLLSVNPNLTAGGYPENWTEYTITISGLSGQASGRMAFRYYVTNGGPTGANSNYIGIDTFSYTPVTTTNWITVTPPGSGNGNGPVVYSVAQNTTGAPRTGTITIADKTFFVHQSAGTTVTTRKPFDFDGDGKADLTVFRPSNGYWYISNSGSNGLLTTVQFGVNGDLIAPADFDGDGKTDICVFRPSNGSWYRLNSSNNTFYGIQFGTNGDLPVPGDFDGDTKADIAVYRRSAGSWYRLNSSNGQFIGNQFGIAEDKPIVGDFDGDGKNDLTVFRPSNGTWYRINSSTGQFVGAQFGVSEDKPVAADYDGDGKADLAVFRPSNGYWYRINSINNAFTATQFGVAEDKPSPADFDGDAKADLVVFRPSSGTWYLLRSTAGFTGMQFGANGDAPAPNAFVK